MFQNYSIFNLRSCWLSWTKRLKRRYIILALSLTFIAIACSSITEVELPPTTTETTTETTALKIWWDKGFTLEEDEALQQLVNNWEQQRGKQINLSFYTTDELSQKVERELRAGHLPDIIMSFKTEGSLNAKLAWEGKLADVSDVIKPVKRLYPEAFLKEANFYNNVEQKRSYYAIPIHQGTIHVYYWRDMLKQVGRRESNIPKDWDGFWEFWKQMQDDLRSQGQQTIYGLGFPLSVEAADTYYLFEQVLEAYDIQILAPQGQLLVDEPQVRQGLVKILNWYAQFYQQGYIPPATLHWLNPDNNRNLLNRTIVMTPNETLSIPAAVRQDPDTYRNKLGILEFPNKPNGKPMRYPLTVQHAILFAESKNQKLAKDFLAYLIQPENIGTYLKAAGGRNLPVMTPVWNDPFWKDPHDPHISTAAKTLREGQTRPFYIAYNPAYSQVLRENVWGKALKSILVEGKTSEQAADGAIKRIKEIFEQWK